MLEKVTFHLRAPKFSSVSRIVFLYWYHWKNLLSTTAGGFPSWPLDSCFATWRVHHTSQFQCVLPDRVFLFFISRRSALLKQSIDLGYVHSKVSGKCWELGFLVDNFSSCQVIFANRTFVESCCLVVEAQQAYGQCGQFQAGFSLCNGKDQDGRS